MANCYYCGNYNTCMRRARGTVPLECPDYEEFEADENLIREKILNVDLNATENDDLDAMEFYVPVIQGINGFENKKKIEIKCDEIVLSDDKKEIKINFDDKKLKDNIEIININGIEFKKVNGKE